ncbi:MAG: 50S ribosomal protein L2 [Candidatus Bathyarchaeota archaeon]|nr:50S ribosomal protein L2 [Candidatus Bathyarchaeota archaeon]
MGKRIKVQRRGRGTPVFQAAHSGKISQVRYPKTSSGSLHGVVKDIVHEAGRGAPLALIELSNGESFYSAAPEGTHVDQEIFLGPDAPLKVGNIIPLSRVPEGTLVNNIELKPGDGGKIARASGGFATVIAHNLGKTVLKLPSKRSIQVSDDSLATIGVISGGGRLEKPRLKAGEGFHAAMANNKVYPIAHGVKMTAASHPHGGGRHRRPGKSTTVSRNSPPGAKVGLIAARVSGRGGSKRLRE